MGSAARASQRKAHTVAELTAWVEALQARLEKLERPAPNGNGHGHDRGAQSRRDLLKLAGAPAAGAARPASPVGGPAARANKPPPLRTDTPTPSTPTDPPQLPTRRA